MLIIVDKKIPEKAKERLTSLGLQWSGFLVELETNSLVYPAISGHPDIFFCKTPQTLVIAPNLPDQYVRLLDKCKISYIQGNIAVGKVDSEEESTLQSSNPKNRKNLENKVMACYNAAIDEQFLVHKLEYTDPVILENCHYLKKIAVRQGYTRCNLLLLKNNHYITSDQGIHKTLQRAGLEGLYVEPGGILLPGFQNGFIGGAMGLFRDTIYIIGSLRYLPEGQKIIDLFNKLDYPIVELYQGPLFDGGGILFI